MSLRRMSVHLFILLGLAFSLIAPAHANEVTRSLPLARAVGGINTDGTTVVWGSYQPDIGTHGIYGASLADLQPFPIAVTSLSGQLPRRSNPVIDNGVVVWTEQLENNGTIRGKRLATGEEFVVANAFYIVDGPGMSADTVVWYGKRSMEEPLMLMTRNITTMADPIPLAQITGLAQGIPQTNGRHVVWGELTAYGKGPSSWAIYVLSLAGGNRVTVAEGKGTPSYELRDNTLVYTQDRSIISYDLRNHQSTVIETDVWTDTITFDGRYVLWNAYTENLATGRQFSLIRAHDVETGSTFTMPSYVIPDYQLPRNILDANAGVLLWYQGYSDEMSSILVTPVAALLPSARRPSLPPSVGQVYFPETGHNLAYGFKDFWERNGGLPVFGYPLTEEFDERNPDTGQAYTVQYFERQRYEYHPENTGTPYEVLLGRLGVTDAERRGLINTAPFQPLSGDVAGDTDCTFFAETGHRMCGVFRDYWGRYGLEFGDRGVSFRESLALFGYPISEAYYDDELGRTVQYFERARFEEHPQNPEPYRVLFGHLGVELINERGWQTNTSN